MKIGIFGVFLHFWCFPWFIFPFPLSSLPRIRFPLQDDRKEYYDWPYGIMWVRMFAVSPCESNWLHLKASQITWTQVKSSDSSVSKWIRVGACAYKWVHVKPSECNQFHVHSNEHECIQLSLRECRESKWVHVKPSPSDSKWVQTKTSGFRWFQVSPS